MRKNSLLIRTQLTQRMKHLAKVLNHFWTRWYYVT